MVRGTEAPSTPKKPSSSSLSDAEEKERTPPKLTLRPRDAYRQRVYLEPLGVYLQADCGALAGHKLGERERERERGTRARMEVHELCR